MTAPLPGIGAPGASSELAIDAVLGVDPGVSGGLALLDADGRVLGCWDTPTYKRGKGAARDYDRPECVELVRQAAALRPGVVLLVELLRSFPGRPGMGSGNVANYQRGRSVELWATAAAAVGVRHEEILPKDWQRTVRADAGPEASLAKARLMYPRETLHLKKHSGRAAALLIAEAGRRTLVRPAGGE